MKTASRMLLLLVLLFTFPAMGDEIQWLKSLEQAKQQAQETKRPILIHFDADWCGPCKRLDRMVFSNAELAKAINAGVVPVRLNVDKHPKIADEFGIDALPTDVYLSMDGEVISSQASPRTTAAYKKTIQRLVSDHTGPQVRVAEAPQEPEFVFPPIRQPSERDER